MHPAPDRRARKRQQTADHLADTAWSLFEAAGFEAVAMEQIAAAADVAKATLYKHFPVKEALLRHRFHRELAEHLPDLLAALAPLPGAAARLRGFLARSAAWAEAHRPYLLPYVRFRLGQAGNTRDPGEAGRSGMDRILVGFIAEGQATGEFRADIPAATLAEYAEYLYLAVLLRWLLEDGGGLAAAMEQMVDFLVSGLGPGHERTPLP